MKKEKNEGIFIRFIFPSVFMFVLLISLANAKLIAVTESGGLEILSPNWDSVPQYKELDVYWHVFNATSYKTNQTTTCYCHVYSINVKGEHIAGGVAHKHGNDRDFEFELNANNFSKLGDYRMLIECNSSGQVAGKEYAFTVTPQGKATDLSVLYYIIILFAYGIVIFGTIKRDEPLTILGTFALFFLGLYILFWGIDIYKNQLTDAFAWITLAIAFYISLRVGIEYIDSKN